MKKCLFFPVFCLLAIFVNAQSQIGWDTIAIANLDSDDPFEPEDLPLFPPSGFDQDWVNWSVYGHPQRCYQDTTLKGWYPAYDETDPSGTSTNFAFTSCSFTEDAIFPCTKKTENWLILPPVYLQGPAATLSWKSASHYGPYWVDGYKVVLSTATNNFADFSKTLFTAAEMIRPTNVNLMGTLNPNNYVYSQGYVHADRYSKPEYFIQTFDSEGYPVLLGQFEPHAADLSEFSGQQVYIAFVHNSNCDDRIQIDDIVIVDSKFDTAGEPAVFSNVWFSPNVFADETTLRLRLKWPVWVQVLVSDVSGKTVFSKLDLGKMNGENQIHFNFEDLKPGIYFARVKTELGSISRKIVKI